MGMCEGNWRSEVRWEKKDGQPPEVIVYKDDGLVHVCPYSDGEPIKGYHILGKNSPALENGTCTQDGEGRFKIKYQWKLANGTKTFFYEGNGRVMDVNGPTFIYGTVRSEGGGGDAGTWQAIRVGHSRGPGPGEEGKQGTHDSGTTPNG